MLSPGAATVPTALTSTARQGEAETFAQLFDRSYPMIHAFSNRLCGQAADADDIASADRWQLTATTLGDAS
jgi:hypothetical protein